MRQSNMLEFPLEEYKNRMKKLLTAIRENEWDAVILTNKENMRYFTGYQLIVWGSGISKPACVIITKDGDVTMITGYTNRDALRATSWVEDVVVWDRLGRNGALADLPEAIHDVLVRKGVDKGRIGMETGVGFRLHLHMSDYNKLMGRLTDAAIVDAGPAIWEIRVIKSALEIERVRMACKINIQAYEAAFQAIRFGMTEMELYRVISQAMIAYGADEVFPMGIRAGVERYAQSNCPPGDRPIREGEIILIDGGPGYRGYFSDIIREAVIGEPTSRQQELYNIALAACEKGLEHMKPGMKCGEVCSLVDSFVDEQGYGDYYDLYRGWIGHSVGMSIHEMPAVELGSEVVLQPGMVFAIEPTIYEEGVGMFTVEENILITDTGCEVLTPISRELRIL
ncbi:aminopeptidase P family protein [Paenibacillus sp. HN-1]|uniref:M24 family metallopeptidase n=2 Tax=Paenibacillus TaxID=44249 RepID=UPI001CA7F1FE|nr:Xaa-Pro peptidase family protein [Paenibacillus sp. CGMCC 1.18879]MBY9078495.1 aminopeptidase P family protein [Paenibacillus sp. CGMCC 1.18879]MBY9082788.1 aminopeptidase P family protein [Paenibacillus sinensis]